MEKKYFSPEIEIIYLQVDCLFNSQEEKEDNLGQWDDMNW